MSEEANRNAWTLSRNNPSIIKELHRNSPAVFAIDLTDDWDAQPFSPAHEPLTGPWQYPNVIILD